MELKLAKKDLNSKCEVITPEKIEARLSEKGSAIYYLDKDNSLKDIQKLCAQMEKKARSVHWNELRFGLDKDSYIYEFHIINH